MIVIVDYGMGNLRSIENKLHRLGAKSTISSDPKAVEGAEKLILPGVGSFDAGMRNLEVRGLLPALQQRAVVDGIPLLGICLGMHLMTHKSEEGNAKGLGWIAGETRRFDFSGQPKKLRVPHVGWNTLTRRGESLLLQGIPQDASFYFVHSYFVGRVDEADVVATTHYGVDFVSAIQHGNLYGSQFHPEKSHEGGFQLLKNFVESA